MIDSFHPLSSAIVRLRKINLEIVGTGFLVSDRHILTCAHVVNAALERDLRSSREPDEIVNLDFPFIESSGVLKGRVVLWLDMVREILQADGIRSAYDIAGLELETPITTARPVKLLAQSNLYDHQFQTFGFPSGISEGIWVDGRLFEQQTNGWIQMEGNHNANYFIKGGFSGAPVYDVKLKGVVGMVATAFASNNIRIAQMIPSTTLLQAWEVLAGNIKDLPDSPYKGLAAFREKDKDDFFGRQQFIKQLFKIVTQKPLVALVGNSGSGKSSVVFAGLVPKLREEEWLIASFRPQGKPFKNLATALIEHLESKLSKREKLVEAKNYAKNFQKDELRVIDAIDDIVSKHNKPLMLIIDQFEELFTLTLDKDLQHSFLEHIVEATQKSSQHFRLLVTLRSDFLSHALNYADFGQALSQTILTLTAMSRKELCEVIEKPAERQGVSLEAGLTDIILDDVLTNTDEKDVAGRLPLLEFTLTLLWDKQEKFILTHEAYKAIGKVEGALARHAEKVFSKYTSKEQEKLKHIFTQLVRPGEGTQDTRQVSNKEQIGEQIWNLVTKLASERLVITDQAEDAQEETVEVIHEALIRSWYRLKEWVDADRDFRIWQNHLRQTAEIWGKNYEDKSILLQGRQLLQAEEYLESHKEQIKDTEDFIKASIANQREEENKRKRQQMNLILAINAIAIVFAVLAGLAGWFGINAKLTQRQVEKQRDRAENAEAEAKEAANVTLARHLSTQAILIAKNPNPADGFIDLAALLAVQGTKIQRDFESASSALRVLQNSFHLSITFYGHGSAVYGVGFSPDGTKIVSHGSDGNVRLWNAKTGNPIIEPWLGNSDYASSVALVPNSTKVVSRNSDNTLFLWDAETGRSIGLPWQEHNDVTITSLAFSSDGTKIIFGSVSGGFNNTLRLWNTKTGKFIGSPWQGHNDFINSVAFSPDGTKVVSGSSDRTLHLWNTRTGKLIGLPWHNVDGVGSVAFSPDGTKVVSGSYDSTLRLWETKTGKPVGLPWQGHSSVVTSVAFSPDGTKVVSGSYDNTLRLWDTETGKSIGSPWQGHSSVVTNVAFSPDGTKVVSGSLDHTVRLWNVEINKSIGEPWQKHSADVTSVAFSPDGTKIVSGSRDKTVRLWDLETRSLIGEAWQGHSADVTSVAFSSNGTKIISGGKDGTVRLWNTRTGNVTGEAWLGRSSSVYSIAFSPDSTKVVSGSDASNTLHLWDVKIDKSISNVWQGHDSYVASVAFSPDSTKIVSGSGENTLRLWDAETGNLIGEPWLGHNNDVSSVAFSPDGTKVVSGSKPTGSFPDGGLDYTVRLWDVETGNLIGEPWLGHYDYVASVAFSPDGTKVASGSKDKTVQLWDVETGNPIGEAWLGHNAAVTSVAFSPDGTKVVSGSEYDSDNHWNQMILIWDVNEDSWKKKALPNCWS